MKNKICVVKHFRALFQEWAGVTDRRSIPAAARCHRPMSPCPHLIPATLPLDFDPLNTEKEIKMAIDFHDNQHISFFPLRKSMLRCDVLKLQTGVTECGLRGSNTRFLHGFQCSFKCSTVSTGPDEHQHLSKCKFNKISAIFRAFLISGVSLAPHRVPTTRSDCKANEREAGWKYISSLWNNSVCRQSCNEKQISHREMVTAARREVSLANTYDDLLSMNLDISAAAF